MHARCARGAALYISLVEVPALEELQDAGGDALPFFQHTFPKAAALQAPLAFAASAFSLGTFIAGAQRLAAARLKRKHACASAANAAPHRRACRQRQDRSAGWPRAGQRRQARALAGQRHPDGRRHPLCVLCARCAALFACCVPERARGGSTPAADTMKFMMPLNKQLLLKEAASQPREWKRAKLSLWGSLHHARTAASLAAMGLIVYKVFAKEGSAD
jgi:hypothetical protein